MISREPSPAGGAGSAAAALERLRHAQTLIAGMICFLRLMMPGRTT